MDPQIARPPQAAPRVPTWPVNLYERRVLGRESVATFSVKNSRSSKRKHKRAISSDAQERELLGATNPASACLGIGVGPIPRERRPIASNRRAPLFRASIQVRLIGVPVSGFRSRATAMSNAPAEEPDVRGMFDRYKERLRRTVRLRLDRRLTGFVDSSGVLKMAREEVERRGAAPAGSNAQFFLVAASDCW